MTPQYLYKLVSQDQWKQSQIQKEIVLSSNDHDFIHLATEDQVDSIAKKFFKDVPYIVLKLDSSQFVGRLVYETNPGGTTKYYHLYEGHIPFEAIISTLQYF